MNEKIVDVGKLDQLKCEISEATGLIKTIVDLSPIDEATATTHAIEELARKAGWLLDLCTQLLGDAGVVGPEWVDWCGGHPARAAEAQNGKYAKTAGKAA